MFNVISQLTKYKARKSSHPPFLFGTEGLIERLPRIGELLKIGCSLSQGLGAPLQKLDRITVPQDLDRTTLMLFTQPCCHGCNAGLPVPRPGANSLYRRPE